jgi:uncharacterized protein DUF4260
MIPTPDAAGATDGAVVGGPRIWLRLEGVTLAIGALIAYASTGKPWWLVPVVLFAPDLLMIGYLGGTRLGAQCYNVAHAAPIPALIVWVAWWRNEPLLLALGLVWLAHIGMDRVLGYGLKYNDSFKHTHLGQIGRSG